MKQVATIALLGFAAADVTSPWCAARRSFTTRPTGGPTLWIWLDRRLFALRGRQPGDRRATPGLEGFDHDPVFQRDVDVVDAAYEPILA
jgi:hypothetical protein